ncbi:hypothetical protein [Lysinibacillus sphaericus]
MIINISKTFCHAVFDSALTGLVNVAEAILNPWIGVGMIYSSNWTTFFVK